MTSTRFTHGTVVLSRAWQTSCETSITLTRLQNSVRKVCMDFTRCVEDVELRRLRIDHDDALEAL